MRSCNPKKGTINELSGSRTATFLDGDFKVIDCGFTAPDSEYSFGQTVIWHRDIPVWSMSYQGFYLKGAIPFLKRALIRAYELEGVGEFVGGRGPQIFKAGDYTYINCVEPPNDWRHFRGIEKVFCKNVWLGWHQYQGLFLPSD